MIPQYLVTLEQFFEGAFKLSKLYQFSLHEARARQRSLVRTSFGALCRESIKKKYYEGFRSFIK